MILGTFIKQPSEVKDYDIDFAPWLSPLGDTLDEVLPFVECLTDPADTSLVCGPGDVRITTNYAKFWVSGGTAGNRYKLTARAYTVGGRIDESELIFVVRDY